MNATLAALVLSASVSFAQNVPAPDRNFVLEAARGGMMEVQLGQIAVKNAQSPQVRDFGQRMIDDHSKANDRLKQVAQTKNITLPADLDPAHKNEVQKLSALKGPEFDRSYMQLMVSEHKKDVAAFERESRSGKDPEIRQFAAETLPVLQEHLRLAETIAPQVGAGPGRGAAPGTGMGTGGARKK